MEAPCRAHSVCFSKPSCALLVLWGLHAMTDADSLFEDDDFKETIPSAEFAAAKKALTERCKLADLDLEAVAGLDEESGLRIGMKCGRSIRWLYCFSHERVKMLLSIPFERYVFLSDLEAICCYEEGIIEAGIRSVSPALGSMSSAYRRLFGIDRPYVEFDSDSAKVTIAAGEYPVAPLEIIPPSPTHVNLWG
jgi:hypothetical protein